MKKKRIYICGPITGIPGQNVHEFEMAEIVLRRMGCEPVNPHKLDHRGNSEHHEFMRTDLMALLGCDAICLLDGYWDSKGCNQEIFVAKAVKLEFYGYRTGVVFSMSPPLLTPEWAEKLIGAA